jgi:CDP-diacylglycerol--glycerol-3-phosphate 3-phosphatidyltransferase
VPITLTCLRGSLAPVVVLLAIAYPSPAAFGACLIVALVSDVLDGVVARRLRVATSNLRRLDSIADTIFYLSIGFASWYLHPTVIADHLVAVVALLALELTRHAFDIVKFGREASYHMWSSRLWGIALFGGSYSLLVLGSDGVAVTAAIYLGIVADVEGLIISIILPEWKNDVPTVVHAWRQVT